MMRTSGRIGDEVSGAGYVSVYDVTALSNNNVGECDVPVAMTNLLEFFLDYFL